MDKITEALKKLIPADRLSEVTAAVNEMLTEAKKELETEFNTKLEEAYGELSKELKDAEATAERGYQEAYTIITDLRNRMTTMKNEMESQLEEGYEEAYQMLLAERGKNEKLEVSMYEEYDKKLAEMKNYMIDKIDEFLTFKGKEIYEQARRDVLSDPALAEHKLTLNKIVETVAGYISDEDYALATSSKVDELSKMVDELKGQQKILEAKNIRISMENNKLNEAVRQAQKLMTESTNNAVAGEKKERIEKAKNAEGRGKTAVENVEVIKEHKADETKPEDKGDTTLVEAISPDQLGQWRTLSGIPAKK